MKRNVVYIYSAILMIGFSVANATLTFQIKVYCLDLLHDNYDNFTFIY